MFSNFYLMLKYINRACKLSMRIETFYFFLMFNIRRCVKKKKKH